MSYHFLICVSIVLKNESECYLRILHNMFKLESFKSIGTRKRNTKIYSSNLNLSPTKVKLETWDSNLSSTVVKLEMQDPSLTYTKLKLKTWDSHLSPTSHKVQALDSSLSPDLKICTLSLELNSNALIEWGLLADCGLKFEIGVTRQHQTCLTKVVESLNGSNFFPVFFLT